MAERRLAVLLLLTATLILLAAASTWLPAELWRARIGALAPDGQIEFLTPVFLSTIRVVAALIAGLAAAAAGVGWRQRPRLAPWLDRQIDGLRGVGHDLARDLLAPAREPGGHRWLLLAVLLLGVGLRAWQLDVAMRHDESKTFEAFVSKPLVQGLSNYYVPNNHILHTALAHGAWRLGGDHPSVLRLPAFLAGCAVLLLAYGLARRLFDSQTALLTAALAAVCPPLIDFSVNARGYSLVAFFTLISFLVATGLRRRHPDQPKVDDEEATAARWLTLSALGALGLWTVPVMLIPLVMIYAWLLWPSQEGFATSLRRLPAVLASGGAAAAATLLLYTPAIFGSGFEKLVGNRYVQAQPAFEAWSQLPALLLRVALWTTGGGFVLACAAVAVVIAVLPGDASGSAARRLAGSLLVGGIGIVALQRTLPENRVFLALVPIFCLLVAVGLARALARLPHPSRAGAVLALMIVLIFGGVRLQTGQTDALECPEAERIARVVQRIAPTLDPPLLTASPAAGPMRFYLRRLGVPLDHFHWHSSNDRTRELGEHHRRLLVVERRGTFTADELGLAAPFSGETFTRRELESGEICRLVELNASH